MREVQDGETAGPLGNAWDAGQLVVLQVHLKEAGELQNASGNGRQIIVR